MAAGRLEDKVAIVTGAGQGVGLGIATAFAKEGAAIALVEFNAEQGRAAAAALEALGARARFVHCDVAQREQVDAAVAETIEVFGAVDILVNNAQRAPASPVPFMEHTDEIFELCFSTALRGGFYFMQAVYPHMKGRGGKIINLGSAAGYEGLPGQAAYAASKEALRAISRSAAREWGRDGINVNVLCPFANSPGFEILEREAPDFVRKLKNARPIQRVGDCELDIGRAALFLASEDSSFITAHTLAVDGGGAILR